MIQVDDLKVCQSVNEFQEALYRHFELHPFEYKRKFNKRNVVDVTATLDIETYVKFNQAGEPLDGWIYSIQMNIAGVNCVVRYVEDFIRICNMLVTEFSLDENTQLIFYVHNLGYEYYWLSQILRKMWCDEDKQPEALFLAKTKPLMLNFPNGICLRDSFKLFQKSLEEATKDVTHKKAVGDIDHTKCHDPDTDLTADEWRYIVYDVQGLFEAIEKMKTEYHYTQASIPYTNTGRVRERLNSKIRSEKGKKTRKVMNDLILDRDSLCLAYNVSAGGSTHASRFYAGKTCYNCNSYDLKSAHPSQMLLRSYPYGKPYKWGLSFDELYNASHCGAIGWIAKLKISNFMIRYNCPEPTISVSKCDKLTGKNGVYGYDNGRVLGADFVNVFMDSNDFRRFKIVYEYESVEIIEAYAFDLKELPKTFFDTVLEDFRVKERTPKDTIEYNFSKICVNTYFGVCDQKQIRDTFDITISNDGIEAEKHSWLENLETATDEEIYNAQKKAFPYLWGLWTASLSRLALFKLQLTVGWKNLIYWDTDSVKYIGEKCSAVEKYNAAVMKIAEEKGATAIDRDGKKVYIGIAEDEATDFRYGYQEFRALHAKCYADIKNHIDPLTNNSTPLIETTIAGVSKKSGSTALIDPKTGKPDLNRLSIGLVIPDAGGFMLTYVSRPIHVTSMFKRHTLKASYIVMRPRVFEILDHVKKDKNFIPECEYEIVAG